jgi:thiazole synthase ThiGH ThiG subunit
MTNLDSLHTAFAHRQAFKAIAGLHNFDAALVTAVVEAATLGGATFVDIAARPDLVKLAKGLTHLPICASAVDAEQLAAAVEAGADLVEIGNFDSFYAQGILFEAPEIIALTKATRQLLPHTLLSVTVPHILTLDRQVELAQTLVSLGTDIIQTEGGTSSAPRHSGTLGLMEKAAPTLAAAAEISRAVAVPVLCASGISSVTAPLAIAAGAAGVGVGSAINRLNDPLAMVAAVRSIAEALQHSSYATKAAFRA